MIGRFLSVFAGFRWIFVAAGLAVLAALAGVAVGTTVAADAGAPVGWTSGLAFGTSALGLSVLLVWLLPAEAMPPLSLAVAALVLATASRTAWLSRSALHWEQPGDTALDLAFAGLLVLALARPLRLVRRADMRAGVGALWGTSGWVALLAGALALTAIHVEASHRILFWDTLNYWDKTATVSELVQRGLTWSRLRGLLLSAGDEYSMYPAILPGLLAAALRSHGLLGYTLAAALCYVVPTLLALGGLGLALAGSLDPRVRAAASRERIALASLGALAAVALLPRFLDAFLQSFQPDIGGVLLLVLLLSAWRWLLRLLLVPVLSGAAARRAFDLLAAGVLVAALSLLSFVFRRWYVFEVVGDAAAATFLLGAALVRPPRPRSALLRDAGVAACGAGLCALAGGVSTLEQWIVQWQHRYYSESYASYWGGWPGEFAAFLGGFGLLVPLGCAGFLVFACMRGERTLPVLLLAGTALSLAGFYRIQGMSTHHAYLLMPLLSGAAAAVAILVARRIGIRPTCAGLLLFGVLLGWAPRQHGALALIQPDRLALRPYSEPDAAGLVRLGHWLGDTLTPDDRYCVAASSAAINIGSISNVWQVDTTLAGGVAQRQAVALGEVDSRDGPPDARLRQCTLIIAATPPQTHLAAASQQSILLVGEDLLAGTGISAAFQRLDLAIKLPGGATLLAFRRVRPISDDEFSELRRRFYAGKGDEAARYQARFGPP